MEEYILPQQAKGLTQISGTSDTSDARKLWFAPQHTQRHIRYITVHTCTVWAYTAIGENDVGLSAPNMSMVPL